MIRAAGILYLAEQTGLCCFVQRSGTGDCAGQWCLPGGKIEEGESPEDAAIRESTEEIGSAPDGKRTLLSRTVRLGPNGEDVDFTTFLQKVPEPFDVTLDSEHTAFTWAPIASPPQPLHPGVEITLRRLTSDELGIARMMAAGELTSPQFYQNVALFDIRITGTNVAYRSAHEEFVYRDPANYLTDDFLARCNGLPVLWDHPRGSLLTSDEFAERIVGTVFVPYIKGEDVWGIAKIYDDGAIKSMAKGAKSTSPAVDFSSATVFRDAAEGNQKVQLEDGAMLLIEGKPSLLDHIAVCDKGVWDKGGPAAGVNTAKADSEMTEEEKKARDDAAKADAAKADQAKADAEGERWGKLMSAMDSFSKRMDSMEEDRKADKARRDSEEEKKANEAANEPGAGDPKEVERKGEKMEAKKADEDEDDKKKSDKKADSKKDEDEKDEKKSDSVKADSAAFAALLKQNEKLAEQIANVQKQVSARSLSDEDHTALAQVQARADSVCAAFGERAPRPLDGETVLAYRRRMATKLKEHSASWKGTDLTTLNDAGTFTAIENQIYADAMVTAKNPKNMPGDVLREHSYHDQTGRTITDFYGEPKTWMDEFNAPRQRVSRINTNSH